jgi:protease IV
MSYQPYGQPARRGILSRLWGALDSTRRFVFNLVFLALLIALLVALFWPSGAKLKEKTVLVLNLDGRIVEQRAGSPRQQLVDEFTGSESQQVQLRDIMRALEAAAKDEKIASVLIRAENISGTGLTTLRETAAAIERFKASGKPVYAWSSGFDQPAFFIAAHANEVYSHPMGGVLLQGYGRYRNYYKEAFERLGVQANLIRVGKFKNAGEPYFTTAPSRETLEADKYLYDAMWATYMADVEKARKLPAGSLTAYIDETVERLTKTEGNGAKMALDAKLISGIKTIDELRAMLIEKGAKDEEKKTFRQVNLAAYLGMQKRELPGEGVGIIVAEGEIVGGAAPPGTIGGRSTAELIRKARDNEKVKAIVLRVNSPGGSAYGSELVRRELELTRKAGKPVVVSMGALAASGGYWIAMSADEVIADAATITGSIGVFAMLPTLNKTMDKLSVYTGGYHSTWLGAAMYDPRRALDPRMGEIVQLGINDIYKEFTTRAATARKTTPDKVDEVAQGRVWTGKQALERGLIDRVGSFTDAINAAKTRGKLDEKASISYIEAERSKFEQYLELFSSKVSAWLSAELKAQLREVSGAAAMVNGGAAVPIGPAVREAARDLSWLAEMGERATQSGVPFAAITHCLCEAP